MLPLEGWDYLDQKKKPHGGGLCLLPSLQSEVSNNGPSKYALHAYGYQYKDNENKKINATRVILTNNHNYFSK